MKKSLLILSIIFLLSAVSFGQTYTPKANGSDGKYTMMKSAGGDTVLILTYTIVGNAVTVSPNGGYFAVQNSWDWIRYMRSVQDTVSAIDTLSRQALPGDSSSTMGDLYSVYWQYTITALDSGIIFSEDPTFPAEKTHYLNGGTDNKFTSDKLNIAYFTNLYIKPNGAIKPQYRVEVSGF